MTIESEPLNDKEWDISFADSFFRDEGVDRLFPRWTRKYKLVKKLRGILDNGRSWWKHSDYSPRQWKYRLLCRFWYKYNTITVKHFPSNTWIDRCSLIRHAVFQILVDFVEKERPFQHFDTEESHNKAEWAELRELYQWYKNFKEFDSIEYQAQLLGYNPYDNDHWKTDFAPIEKYGVDDWGDHKMYSWDSDQTEEERKAMLESMEKEKEWEENFTDKAKRVVELWGMLWT